jgi:5'-deoxynucleotidase YfbR-like HD superfamily hydrolase
MSTPKPTIADLQKFVQEIIFPFYQIERHGELSFAHGRHENNAEHSWSVALFASALAPQVDPKLDIGKVCQYAIVHDLLEVYAGDTSNFASKADLATKELREEAALRRLSEEPLALPWIAETLQAYERQDSDEAQFVKSVDKLLVLLYDFIEEGYFYQKNRITLEQWQAAMQKHREKASKHLGAFKYYDELWNLLLANPQFFYQ